MANITVKDAFSLLADDCSLHNRQIVISGDTDVIVEDTSSLFFEVFKDYIIDRIMYDPNPDKSNQPQTFDGTYRLLLAIKYLKSGDVA